MSVLGAWAGSGADAGYLWRRYGRASVVDRLFVIVRRAICPFEQIVAELPATGRVLDVGCGRGVLGALVRRDRPGLEYVGIDIAERATRLAGESLADERASFQVIEPDLWDRLGDFDCITLVDVLYAVPVDRWPEFLRRCAARLKPGGRLVVKETVGTPRWKKTLVTAQETLAIRILRYTQGEPPHFEDARAYIHAFERSGFRFLRNYRVDQGRPWPHHMFLAERVAAPAPEAVAP